MGGDENHPGLAAAESLLGWWRDSGVDVAVAESPRAWLKPAAARPVVAAPAAPPAAAPAALPDTHSALRDYLGSAPGLPLDRPGARRVLPVGESGAAIMLLAELPADSGETPIAGEEWTLATRMLAAIGLAPEQAYVATLSCFASPGGKLSPAERQECAGLARRHVALAAPGRLLLLGDGPAQALLGEPLARARGRVHKVEGIRTVATFHPRWLLKRTADKALAWRDLLLLMEDD